MDHPAENPWLSIPASDYEGHMSSPAVGQLAFLGRVFAEVLRKTQPQDLAVLGCATGNGFEHVDGALVRRVIGIDINPDYLEILRRRHAGRIPGLQLLCRDLMECALAERSLDLVHAALIFEYVDPAPVVAHAARWLRPGGILCAVLQMPSEHSGKITETPFVSLKSLDPIMRLVAPEECRSIAAQHGLREVQARVETLHTGKKFFVAMHAAGEGAARHGGALHSSVPPRRTGG